MPLLCPCAPAEQELGLKGGSARSEVGPARPVAHRSRSACCAEVAQHQRRPALTARVKAGTSCRRSTRCAPGVPGCGYGPFSVVGRPRVLNIRQRDPQVHRRPRERARDPRTARLGPSGTRPCIRGASSPSRPFLAHVIVVGRFGGRLTHCRRGGMIRFASKGRARRTQQKGVTSE